MKTYKASTEFVPGKHDISYVGSQFEKKLYDLSFEKGTAEGIESKKLDKAMNDTEIAAELGPEPITLGDMLAFYETADKGGWYLCYVEASNGVLWAVNGYWSDGGWFFGARALGRPGGWFSGRQVLSRRFSGPETPDTKNLGDFDGRLKKVEAWFKAHNLEI